MFTYLHFAVYDEACVSCWCPQLATRPHSATLGVGAVLRGHGGTADHLCCQPDHDTAVPGHQGNPQLSEVSVCRNNDYIMDQLTIRPHAASQSTVQRYWPSSKCTIHRNVWKQWLSEGVLALQSMQPIRPWFCDIWPSKKSTVHRCECVKTMSGGLLADSLCCQSDHHAAIFGQEEIHNAQKLVWKQWLYNGLVDHNYMQPDDDNYWLGIIIIMMMMMMMN